MPSVNGNHEEVQDMRFADDVIGIQQLGTDLYFTPAVGVISQSTITRGTFGGQIVAQALMAATETVKAGLNLHSAHCYFVRPGGLTRSTIYQVSRTRDGDSFCSRTVSAIQQGKHILTLQASFHNEDSEPPSFLEYQPVMPTVKHHSVLLSTDEHLAKDENLRKSKDWTKSLYEAKFPVEVKPMDMLQYVGNKAHHEHTLIAWIRVCGNIGEDQRLHKIAGAFISDWTLLWASIISNPRIHINMMASLDHSIWFHRPIKANEWLLYEAVSTQMSNSKALCQGRIWTEGGQLIATVMQEGIIRGKL